MTKTLPPHLAAISRVIFDPEVADAPLTRRVRERLPHLPFEEAEQGVRTFGQGGWAAGAEAESLLYLKHYKGQFLRFCPGTRAYRCCAYRIVHIGENCPLGCTYCILQAYFQDRVLKVWANQDDLFSELHDAFSAAPDTRFRVGTGEFTDSLVLEPVTGYSADLVRFLANYDNVVLELKSKVVDLSWMEHARPDRVLPAWSLNAPAISRTQEPWGAPLEKRLQTARKAADAGFRVCLHFDPIIRYPGWREGYGEIIDLIFEHVKPHEIAYMSLGSFRFMPDLKTAIENNFPHANYIYNEFIPGLDGKQRLLRPQRVEQFQFMVERLRAHGMDRQLYFCMESDEVWTQVFGFCPTHLGGLANHLMRRAFGEE